MAQRTFSTELRDLTTRHDFRLERGERDIGTWVWKLF